MSSPEESSEGVASERGRETDACCVAASVGDTLVANVIPRALELDLKRVCGGRCMGDGVGGEELYGEN